MRETQEINEKLSQTPEQCQCNEQSKTAEIAKQSEEIAKFGGQNEKMHVKRKKRSSPSSLKSLAVGMVAAVAAVAVILAPNIISKPKLSSFDVNVLATSLEYNISVEEKKADNLVVELSGFSVKRTEEFSEAADGIFDNLTPDTVYTISVKGNFGLGETTLAKRTVKTLSAPKPTPPEELTQGKVGAIKISMDYEADILKFCAEVLDENGFLSDFKARIISSKGKAYDIAIVGKITDWQSFDASGLSSGNYNLEISAASSHPSHNGGRLIYLRKIRI